ncbi:MAG: general secretion pathway protein GspF [Acaryochloridaceae cyanobacterium RU_4_10]|nr:general secretion pathway protein GspF [Acaryochloridaceae cyanobacterium RU_4_10]
MPKKTAKRVNYHQYIISQEWRSQHPNWLKAVGCRCTLFPWIEIGKGKPYSIHHLHYRNLGNERLGRDVLPVSKFAHEKILHGLLSGGKSAGKQRNYPNLAQCLVHEWMRQRRWFKVLLGLGLMGGMLLWKWY